MRSPTSPPAISLNPIEHQRLNLLLEELKQVPGELPLTPVHRRSPLLKGWQRADMERSALIDALRRGALIELEDGYRRQYCDGYALVLGNGLIVADFDGRSARAAGEALAKGNGGMPITPMWKGSKGQSALYCLPVELRDRIAKLERSINKITIKEGCAGKDAIELLYDRHSATLPPSAHPNIKTAPYSYQWLQCDSKPLDFSVPIATAPKWICDRFEAECEQREYWATQPKQDWTGTAGQQDVEQWLAAVHPDTLNYDSWIKVGMAIKSAFPDDGLELWDAWSQTGSSYKPRDCEKRWDGFTAGRVPIAYLARLAGFELKVVGAGVGFAKPNPEQTEAQRKRERLIAKRKMVYRSNYKAAVDRATKLSETSEAETVWFKGYAPTLDLDGALTVTAVLKGDFGAGKTEALLRTIIEKYPDRQVVFLTPRRTLGRNTEDRARAKGMDVYVYQDDVALFRQMLRTGQPGLYVFCPQGLSDYHTEHIDWSRTLVVIDEFSGIREEVPGAGDAIFAEYQQMLTKADTLIAADANFSDTDGQLLQMYRRGRRKIYRQVEVKSSKKIHWLEVKTKAGEISLSHDGAWYGLIDQWIEQKLSFIVACDNKLTLLAIQLHCEAQGARLDAATADTIEFNRRVMPNPTEFIRAEGIRHFGYSPVAQSGLDIQADFDRGLLVYQGVIQPGQALQMLGRARKVEYWVISAPRRSFDPAMSFNALTSAKISRMSVELTKTLHSINSGVSIPGVVWGTLQQQLTEIYAAYGSEALQCMLEEKFESIDTIELEGNAVLHKQYCEEVKRREAALIKTADVERGRELLRKKQAPQTDADVWAIEASELADFDSETWAEIQAAEDEAAAVNLIVLLRSKRLDKIKNWVAVTELPEAEEGALLARMKRQVFNPCSQSFRRHQFMCLHQRLKLDKLAQASGKAIADETHFNAQSPVVATLYEQFCADHKLMRLFPQVESIGEFWGLIRKCMSHFGYQSAGKNIRVASATPVPNGRNRDGSQRYSNSRSVYFSGWKPMEESGSELFRSVFPKLVKALRNQILKEHEAILKHSPPDIPIAA